MEIVIVFIMGMVMLGYILKLTWMRMPGRIAESLIAAVFVLLTYDLAASQSKTQIADWLAQPALMLDASVLLTVDVAFQIGFCLLAGKSMASSLSKIETTMMRICLWTPGILIFPSLFALLTQLIFAFTGMDFGIIAWGFALCILILVPALSAGIKCLIPEPEIRLEMIYMVNLIVAALGIIATVNGQTAAAGTSSVEWAPLAGVAVIISSGIVSGILLSKYLTRKKISKIQ